MTDQEEGFAGRWSRLKAETRAKEAEAALAAETPAVPVAAPETAAPAEEPAEAKIELPPLESLTKDSDYSLFMRADVADGTRKEALRKLWTLDPHFAAIDISECHSIDFNAVQTFPEGLLNTIYRVGSGMVEAVEAIEREEAAAKQAAEKVADSTPTAPDKITPDAG
jgi:hypothetical protein